MGQILLGATLCEVGRMGQMVIGRCQMVIGWGQIVIAKGRNFDRYDPLQVQRRSSENPETDKWLKSNLMICSSKPSRTSIMPSGKS
ncbi:MAG: hypothetical protein ABW043_11915 [Devosia sp.]|uniref:hypothetical protein n=1 Tax=Devosia sp. TaxID=1871048 RepID=UPI00339A84A9